MMTMSRRGLRHLDKPGRERVRDMLTCGQCLGRVVFSQRKGGTWYAVVHHAGDCPAVPVEMREAGKTDYTITEPELWTIATGRNEQ